MVVVAWYNLMGRIANAPYGKEMQACGCTLTQTFPPDIVFNSFLLY